MQIITEAEIDEAGWGSVNTPEEAYEEILIIPASQNGEGHKTVKSILTWFFFFFFLYSVSWKWATVMGCVCQWPFNLQLTVDWRRRLTHTHTHLKTALAQDVSVTSELFCSAYIAPLRPQLRRNYAPGNLQSHGYLATNFIWVREREREGKRG